jgi:hypothetical protein
MEIATNNQDELVEHLKEAAEHRRIYRGTVSRKATAS